MASHSCTLLLLLLAVLLGSSAASPFNITTILNHYPDFTNFNSYLTQTQLAAEINSRRTITVLAVDNGAISAVSGMPLDVIRKVLSVHVVLDYFDATKIHDIKKGTTLLTTLFQSTGLSVNQMGFLNITVTPSAVELGSAVPGAGLTAQLVKTVDAQPYDISVLQISSVIVPPGIQATNGTTPPPPPPPPTVAETPKASPIAKKAPAPAASAPSESSPKKKSPSAQAEAPERDAPAPAADETPVVSSDGEDKAPAPAPSSGTKVVFGAGLAAVMGVAMLAAL